MGDRLTRFCCSHEKLDTGFVLQLKRHSLQNQCHCAYKSTVFFCEYSITSEVLISPLERYFIGEAQKCLTIKMVETGTRCHKANCPTHVYLNLSRIPVQIYVLRNNLQDWSLNAFYKINFISISKYVPSLSEPFSLMNGMQTNHHSWLFS